MGGGASSSLGQVWQEMAGRRRCYPLIRGGAGREERRRSSEASVGWRRRGSPTAGGTDTEKGSGVRLDNVSMRLYLHLVINISGPPCVNSCTYTETQSRQPVTTYDTWRVPQQLR